MSLVEHFEYLSLYERSCVFAIDEGLDHTAEERATEFFGHLYTDFSKENELAIGEIVAEANSFALVAAPSGGGKTTIIYSAIRQLNRSGQCFLFDCKRRATKFYGMGRTHPERECFIHRLLKNGLKEAFLRKLDDKINFVFNALEEFYTDEFHGLILRLREANNNDMTIGDSDMDRLRCLFRESPGEIEAMRKVVMKNLTCAEMIRLIKKTLQMSKFLLILDNVDKLLPLEQDALLSIAIDIHCDGATEFGTVLAVRNKNLMRYEKSGSGANVVKVVSLSTDNEITTRPTRLDDPSPEFASDLLKKRQAHTNRLAHQSERVQVRKSMDVFELLKRHVNTAFIDEKLYRLSNNSYREMLTLHAGFVSFLFRLYEAGTIRNEDGSAKLTEWTTRSYLYRWLYATHNPNHEFLLDIVSKYESFRAHPEELPLKCDIELVILAWLVNKGRRAYRINQLVSAFKAVTSDTDTVYEGLYQLYSARLSHRHIELGVTEEGVAIDDLKNHDVRIRLNPLGKEFVKNTITKFEFLHQCLSYPEVDDEDSKTMLKPVEKDMDSKLTTVMEFLWTMKEVHSSTLIHLRNNWHSSSVSWEDHFRGEFCIKDHLILERIAQNHLFFIRNHFPGLLSKWRDLYGELLTDYYEKIGSSKKAEATLYGL